jgi:hypothetical protein
MKEKFCAVEIEEVELLPPSSSSSSSEDLGLDGFPPSVPSPLSGQLSRRASSISVTATALSVTALRYGDPLWHDVSIHEIL